MISIALYYIKYFDVFYNNKSSCLIKRVLIFSNFRIKLIVPYLTVKRFFSYYISISSIV